MAENKFLENSEKNRNPSLVIKLEKNVPRLLFILYILLRVSDLEINLETLVIYKFLHSGYLKYLTFP